MKHLLFLMLVFCAGIACSQNLVPNPGFEEHGRDNSEHYGLHHVVGWYQPTGGTCDYFNTDHRGFTKVPKNDFGTQEPHSGNGYGGFCAYMTGYHEYLAIPLQEPLLAGQKYRLEFFVSLSENSAYAIDKVQALFTAEKILDTTLTYVLGHKPQVTSSSVIEERKEWVPVSGEFIAKGGESYLVIGTFLHDKLLTVKKMKVLQKSYKDGDWAYYYVDDVRLCAVDGNGDCIDEPGPSPSITIQKDTSTAAAYETGKTFILKNVYFDIASAHLQERSFPALDSLAGFMMLHDKLSLTLTGHTDSTGYERNNWPLSENRAATVKDYLVSRGINEKRITCRGYASSRPLDTNATVEGKQKNRRVEARLEEE